MKVFISWSGQPSKQIAAALNEWLPLVIQEADPFFSDEDIPAGSTWLEDITQELKGSVGILCLTPNNTKSEWLHYEAGALSKALPDARVRVMPLLYKLEYSGVALPLSNFNMVKLDRDGLLKIVRTLNDEASRPLSSERLTLTFDRWYDELASKLDGLPDVDEKQGDRPTSVILEEILAIVRGLAAASPAQDLARWQDLLFIAGAGAEPLRDQAIRRVFKTWTHTPGSANTSGEGTTSAGVADLTAAAHLDLEGKAGS